MHRSVFRRPIGILVLGGVLAAPTLAAENLAGQRLDGPQLWAFLGRLVALWDENGSAIDPYGRQLTEQARTLVAPATAKTGPVRARVVESPSGLRRTSRGES